MNENDEENEHLLKNILNSKNQKASILEWKENIDIIMSVSLEKLRRKVQYDDAEKGMSESDMRQFAALTKCYIELSKVNNYLEELVNERIGRLKDDELLELEKRASK